MMIADIHAHLELIRDLDDFIKRAKASGVKKIIANGTNKETNEKALYFSKKYDIVEAALGLYPSEVSKSNINEEIKFIKMNKDKIVALGEVGLDKKEIKNEKEFEKQKEAFNEILKLGEELNLPKIIHSRKAEEEVIEICRNHKKIIMHCFCGKKKLFLKGLEYGYYFSIPPIITRSKQFQEWVKLAPLSRLLTETDSPFLSPYTDKPNESAFIIQTIKKIAEIKEMEEKEVENILFMNYQKIFT